MIANERVPRRIKIDGALRLSVSTVVPRLTVPRGSFKMRWRGLAPGDAPHEVSIAFAVDGDRAALRLSCEPERVIRMVAVPQPRGGRRWFYTDDDGSRSTILMCPMGADRFRSRREWGGISYPCQRMSPRRRAEARAARIRAELRGSADIAAPFPERPAGMHVTTYQRRRAEAEALAAFALAGRRLAHHRHQEPRP